MTTSGLVVHDSTAFLGFTVSACIVSEFWPFSFKPPLNKTQYFRLRLYDSYFLLLTECSLSAGLLLDWMYRHNTTFNNPAYRFESALADYIWDIQCPDRCYERGNQECEHSINYKLTWKILSRAPGYNPITGMCRLCFKGIFFILFHPETASLNKKTDKLSSSGPDPGLFLVHSRFKSFQPIPIQISDDLDQELMLFSLCHWPTTQVNSSPIFTVFFKDDNWSWPLWLKFQLQDAVYWQNLSPIPKSLNHRTKGLQLSL